MRSKTKLALLLLVSLLITSLHGARDYAVAGTFYSKDKDELKTQIKKLLKSSKSYEKQNVNAIIVPHAGYIFSASTAAKAYNVLNRKYKNIFIIGSSHHVNIDGASIYNIGNYKTPLGDIKINQEIVSRLKNNFELFTYNVNAHLKEHTIEVQLPFLQTLYPDDLKIVPIVIATSNLSTIKKISKVLEPYFNDENLFIISTDLSHYPSYEDAKTVDKKTLNSIAANSTKVFLKTIAENKKSAISNFKTSACGWSSVLTLMYLTQNSNYKYELLDYINSGDTKYGDKNKVVGYGAFRIYKDKQKFFLTPDEKDELKEIARLALYEATIQNKKISIDESKISPKLKRPLGAFVTLYKNSNLRGCIGRFEPNQPLYSVIIDMTIAAAQQDPRFKKVTPDELNDINLEISVLTPRKKIGSVDEIEIGKHGIYIQNGLKHGTYLPQVALHMNWDAEEFLRSCAIEKAGMNYSELKNAEIFTYEAIVFGEDKIK